MPDDRTPGGRPDLRADGGTPDEETRRDLLRYGAIGGVGVVLLGGGFLAVTNSTRHELSEEGWAVETTTEGGRSTAEGTLTLPRGRYAVRRVRPTEPVTYELTLSVTSGGSVDVYTIEEAEYARYRSLDRPPRYIESLSEQATTGTTLAGQLEPGDYRAVIDNTGAYGASPSGTVDIEVSISTAPADRR